ncbi:hypothetical protein [Moorena producens]|uniref:hypothetical protein n=1 Tax=Moorena producens TaxID=1155739 RepID=UPI003C7520D2
MPTNAIASYCYLSFALPTLHQYSRFVIDSPGGQCLLMRSPAAVIYLLHCPPYINIFLLFPVPYSLFPLLWHTFNSKSKDCSN